MEEADADKDGKISYQGKLRWLLLFGVWITSK